MPKAKVDSWLLSKAQLLRVSLCRPIIVMTSGLLYASLRSNMNIIALINNAKLKH